MPCTAKSLSRQLKNSLWNRWTGRFQHPVKSLWLVSGVLATLLCLPTLGMTFPSEQKHPQAHNKSVQRSITLEQATLLALKNNAGLKASYHEGLAIEAEGRQRSVLPNPEIALEFEEFAGSGEYSGSEAMQTSLTISQRIELGHKRARHQQVAVRKNDVTAAQQALQATEVIRQTRQFYRHALVAREQLRQANKNVVQCQTLITSIEEAIRAGKKAPIEAQRIMPLQAQAQLRLLAAQTTLKASRQQLCSMWQGREEELGVLDGSLSDIQHLPGLAELHNQIDQTTTVRLARKNHHLKQARFELEQANRIQDVTLSVGVKHDSSTEDNALIAGLSVPFPLFDRNSGNIDATRNRSDQAEQALLQARQTVWQKLIENHRLASIAQQEIVTFEQQLLPMAQAVFESVTFGYDQGKYTVLDVLDAQSRLMESQDRYLNVLADYHSSLTNLEALFDFQLTKTTAAFADPDEE